MGVDFKSTGKDKEFLDLKKLEKIFKKYLPKSETTLEPHPSSKYKYHLVVRPGGLLGKDNLGLIIYPNTDVLWMVNPKSWNLNLDEKYLKSGKVAFSSYDECKKFIFDFIKASKNLHESIDGEMGDVSTSPEICKDWDFWRVIKTDTKGRRTIVHSDGRVFHFDNSSGGASPVYTGTFNPMARAQQLPTSLSGKTLQTFVKALATWVATKKDAVYPQISPYQNGSIFVMIGCPGEPGTASLTPGSFYFDKLETAIHDAEYASRQV